MTLLSEQRPPEPTRTILHVSSRDVLRPLRDQILRLAGYVVQSCRTYDEALAAFHQSFADLVLVDVEVEDAIHEAERFCAEVKTVHHGQLVAFVCNWRVAILTDCPDEILRSEFDPAAFVAGVHRAFAEHIPRT